MSTAVCHQESFYCCFFFFFAQWFATLLIILPFNMVSRVVVTLNNKIISLLLHNSDFASVNSEYAAPYGVMSHRLRTTAFVDKSGNMATPTVLGIQKLRVSSFN